MGRTLWIGLAVAAALAVIAAASGWMWSRHAAAAVDPATGCVRAQPPALHVVALVDVAGGYDPRARRRAAAVVRAARATLQPGDRLTLAAPTDADPARPIVLLSRCAPKDGGGGRQAMADFDTAVTAATARLSAGRAGDAAPLTDALRALAATPEARAPAQRRRWVIVSDMMEHRPGVFSLFAAGATYDTFRASEAGLRPPADLSNVEIEVTQLERIDRMDRQRDARELFWRSYFNETGARGVRWAP